MRVDIFVPSKSVDEQVKFYVDELQLFIFKQDFGMGSALLENISEPSLKLALMPWENSTEHPLFCLTTADCDAEFKRMKCTSFSKGGVFSRRGPSSIFEYPLGKTFSMKDASGNFFVFTEWY